MLALLVSCQDYPNATWTFRKFGSGAGVEGCIKNNSHLLFSINNFHWSVFSQVDTTYYIQL